MSCGQLIRTRTGHCKACGALIASLSEDIPTLCPGKHTETVQRLGPLREIAQREEWIATGFRNTGPFGLTEVPTRFEHRTVPVLGQDVIETWWDQDTGQRMGRIVGQERV